jgi:PKD repeat protein
MKKSLLSLSLLFSLWSFAVINVSGNFPIFNSGAKATEKTNDAEPVATRNSAPVAVKAKSAALTLNPTNFPLEKGSQWSYLDNGTSLDAVSWKVLSYDNAAWATGTAPFGYGDPTTTVISFGPDSANKYITSYFTKDVYVDLGELEDMVEFGLRRDDGAVVYINGVEAFRDNMAPGAFDYLTHSASIVDGADEKRFFTRKLPKTLFQNGVNRIAVEIHNRDGQSSDIGFDMYIKNPAEVVACDDEHISCFTSIAPTAQTPVMILPEEHRFQMILKEGTPHVGNTGNVAGMHDFTGYVPANGSSTTGYLAVNHESNPGGVTMAEMHFDTTTKLWVIDESKPVDLYNADLVTTIRNCSGGVTPWGTVITAEENTTAGDVNGDGYQDVGWLVEIDPVTAQVKEYGNGKQEKLWKMGRMNHENVVVNDAGTRAYYGEDGGSHCVYKFVPTTPGNLYSGNVYVLKLDLALSNDEPSSSTATWIQVPNATPADCNNISSVAGTLGGTNFNGVEDCEIDPITGMIYFTSKGKNRTYRFKDNGATVSHFETFVGGKTYSLMGLDNVVADWKDGNDNLTFDDRGNLWVIQDGGDNLIWVVSPDHTQNEPKVRIHSSMPAGSEPTGLTFNPDYTFGFYSVQHPNDNNAAQMDATYGQVTFNASASVVFGTQDRLGAQTPEADFIANDVTVNEGDIVTFTDLSTNNPTSWMWTFEGGTPATSTEAAPTVTYAEAGTYSVTLTTGNAAGNDLVTKTGYILVEEALGLAENTLGNTVKLYPNPTQGLVTIQLNDDAGKDISVEVYDITGRRVTYLQDMQTVGGNQDIQLDLRQFAGEQVFIIKMTVGDKTGSYKLLKVK